MTAPTHADNLSGLIQAIEAGINGSVFDLTLSVDTSIYADGDVLADTQELASVFEVAGCVRTLQSVQVLDEDDQGIALDLVFLDSNQSIGTENGAPNISDANARKIIGRVSIATGDFIDLGGARVATKNLVGQMLKAAASDTSLYVAAITRGGTPTYTASGLKLKLGFK
jgi:hypothetical protein